MAKTATEKTARPLDVRTNSFDDGTYCMILTGITESQIKALCDTLGTHRARHAVGEEVLARIRDSINEYEAFK